MSSHHKTDQLGPSGGATALTRGAPAGGVLPDASLTALISDGAVVPAARRSPVTATGAHASPAALQPASMDLSLGRKAWRVRASFLPPPGRSVRERLNDGLFMHELDLSAGAVLERGCVYLVELGESLALPEGVSAVANPKSSTGRIDVFVRLVTECAAGRRAAFDEIPAGYHGPLYAEISPRTFSILVREGSRLNQIRFKSGAPRLDDQYLADLHSVTPLVDGAADIDGGLRLSVDLKPFSSGAPIGWRARRHAALINVDVPGVLDPEAYFEPIPAPSDGFIILDPDEFYILSSKESLVIPPDYAGEMTPISPGLGEFRVHYAGFFDPGFGWSEAGGQGSRAVLEVRSHDAPFVLEHGQLVARLVYERMAARPAKLYGADLASHYQGQGLKLSKHFKSET
ncbi:MAG: 2'-deoxycytidine 5'-triphosphate deaminase [Pseudomonadota bacterium]